MCANPIDDSSHVTPGDDGVNQPLTATVREVGVTESEAAQVVYIIRQREIPGGVDSRDLSCLG
jgi:hypothetical protein